MSTMTVPELTGFQTYYGLQLSDIGEDGAVIILGHHHDDPLRVVAALNRHARTFWELTNLLDNRGAELCDLAGALSETHAVVLDRCDDPDHAADWYIEWNRSDDDPAAFPATMWRP